MRGKIFRILSVVISVVIINSIQGCINNSELDGYPTVSFQTEVQPIIAANCTQSGCHGYIETAEFPLMNYNEVLQSVTPGNARKSSLYRAITGRTFEFMPPSPSAPLTEDQIRSIFVWIEQGAQNN